MHLPYGMPTFEAKPNEKDRWSRAMAAHEAYVAEFGPPQSEEQLTLWQNWLSAMGVDGNLIMQLGQLFFKVEARAPSGLPRGPRSPLDIDSYPATSVPLQGAKRQRRDSLDSGYNSGGSRRSSVESGDEGPPEPKRSVRPSPRGQDDYDTASLMKKTVSELKEMCRVKRLKTGGVKAELAKRIHDFEAQFRPQDHHPAGVAPVGSAPPDQLTSHQQALHVPEAQRWEKERRRLEHEEQERRQMERIMRRRQEAAAQRQREWEAQMRLKEAQNGPPPPAGAGVGEAQLGIKDKAKRFHELMAMATSGQELPPGAVTLDAVDLPPLDGLELPPVREPGTQVQKEGGFEVPVVDYNAWVDNWDKRKAAPKKRLPKDWTFYHSERFGTDYYTNPKGESYEYEQLPQSYFDSLPAPEDLPPGWRLENELQNFDPVYVDTERSVYEELPPKEVDDDGRVTWGLPEGWKSVLDDRGDVFYIKPTGRIQFDLPFQADPPVKYVDFLKVVSSHGTQVYFKVAKTMRMDRLMHASCIHLRIPLGQASFTLPTDYDDYGGVIRPRRAIRPDDTAEALKLADEDVIMVSMEQAYSQRRESQR